MTTSTDGIINDNNDTIENDIEKTEKHPWNPLGINLRYTPPVKEIKQEQKESVKFARNGTDPKENIKKFY